MMQLICVSILFLYLISRPIRIKVKGSVDLSAGKGELSFSVFYITLFRAEGLLENRSLTEGDFILMQKKKKTKLHIDIKKTTPVEIYRAIKRVDLSFLGNLDVKEVYLSLHYGDNDAVRTTLLLSLAKMAFYSAMSVIKSKQNVLVYEEFVPMYNMRTLKMDFHGIFTLSVADIIYGYLAGKLKHLKSKLPKKEFA